MTAGVVVVSLQGGITPFSQTEDLCQDKEDEDAIRASIADPNAISTEEKLTCEETRDLLAVAIEALPKQEKLVVSLYYHEVLFAGCPTKEWANLKSHSKSVYRVKKSL